MRTTGSFYIKLLTNEAISPEKIQLLYHATLYNSKLAKKYYSVIIQMKLTMVLKKESQQENRFKLPVTDSSQKKPRNSRTNHGFYSPDTTAPPTPLESAEIPDFTGPMAAFAVSFFQDKLHAKRLVELKIANLDENLVDRAYNLASEYIPPGTNRAELRYNALVALKTMTQVSQERLNDWLAEQPEEVSGVIKELIAHISSEETTEGALDEVIRLALLDKQKPLNMVGRN